MLISIDLLKPPFSAGLRDYKIFAPLVTMPETTMNKYHSFIFWEDKVWFAW